MNKAVCTILSLIRYFVISCFRYFLLGKNNPGNLPSIQGFTGVFWLWLYKRGPSGENQKIGELYQDDSKETFLDAIQRLTGVKEIEVKPY